MHLKQPNRATLEARQRVMDDGVTHINTDSYGNTELGKQLDFIAFTRFVHPVLGEFSSMEAFWGYVRSEEIHDELRYFSGVKAKKANQKVKMRRLNNIVDILIDGEYYKVMQDPNMLKAMRESTLPFDNYYIHGSDAGEILIRNSLCQIVIKVHEEVRKLIKSGAAPKEINYDIFFDRPRAEMRQL